MRVLGLGTYDVRVHPRPGVILSGLRRRGHAVRELNEPLGVGTADRVRALKDPRAAARFAGRLAAAWGRIAAGSRAYRGERSPDAILVGYLGHFDVLLARALYPRARILLDHLVFASDTAADRGLAGGGPTGRVKGLLLRGLDASALAVADVVIVDTPEHLAMIPDRHRGKGIVVPVGAPPAWPAAAARRRAADAQEASGRSVGQAAFEWSDAQADGRGPTRTDGPREAGSAGRARSDGRISVVFFGLFTPLQGAPVIARALAECERRGVGLDVTLVGDGQDAGDVRRLLPRGGGVSLTWLDWVDCADLPGLVARHDVCLGIFGTSDKARRVVPNKAYQGIAAGCALVTSDTPPQRAVLGDAAVFVPPGDPSALACALASLADPASLAQARARSSAAAERFRPETVVAGLAEVLA